VKDVLAIQRLAENPRDSTSAFRVLQLLDGVGPAIAKRAVAHLASHGGDLKSWRDFPAPPAAQWPAMLAMLLKIAPNEMALAEQIAEVRRFYTPVLERRYDQAEMRRRDIEQLEQIAGNFRSRSAMLTELMLDPPASTQDLAGPPLREEDYLILSTIHSAKGCEWDCVYVIHAADGNIPSDMATGDDAQIEEERRLFYVALTRARDFLEVVFPLKHYHKKWSTGDRHTYAQLTRFLPETIVEAFERVSLVVERPTDAPTMSAVQSGDEIRKKIAAMWG
jgi:DNA helicase-2/ATP-dependent DNA helicase PcrA